MSESQALIGPHGGYRKLYAYQICEIVFDGPEAFCSRAMPRRSRTKEQMVQAARSGKQNIAEGSVFSGTSKKLELKLINAARASLEELVLDYQDFLRQSKLEQWGKDDVKTSFIRRLAYRTPKSYETYRNYIEEKTLETAANTLICLIHQAKYMLDRLLKQLEKDFLEEGGFTERLHRARTESRERLTKSPDRRSG